VAAAGETEGLRPAIAWGCLLLIVFGLASVVGLAQKLQMTNRVPMPTPPDVLAAKARDLAHEFGYTATPVDSFYSFDVLPGYRDYLEKNDPSLTRWNNLSSGVPPTIVFWYRESPQFLGTDSFIPAGEVSLDDPPNSISGMCQIVLDPQGHLLKFEAVPPQVDTSTEAVTAPDWVALFAAASLDPNLFKVSTPQWTPLATTDARAAWEGTWPGHPELPVRVEAASYRGKLVYFNLVSRWDKPDRMQEEQRGTGEWIQTAILITVFFSIVLLAISMARKNVRSGRCDRKGAARLALLAFLTTWASVFLFAHHVPTPLELVILLVATAWGLMLGAISWLLYIALEPHVRRRWPSSLISWSRLLMGQVWDPLVGRDLLAGTLTGIFWAVAARVEMMVPGWMGKMPVSPILAILYESLNGFRMMIGVIPLRITGMVFTALAFFFIFFLVRLVLRKEWLAALATILFVSVFAAFGTYPVLSMIFGVIVCSIGVMLLIRFGLLALVVALFMNSVLQGYPLTTHLSAWYAEPTFLVFSLILATAIFGFYTSTAGKSRFGGISLDS
jgi:hypothetical protein